MNIGSGELLKQPNPDEKGISFLPYSREINKKRQVQMVIRFLVGPIQMAWSPPQPGEGFKWSSLANMTRPHLPCSYLNLDFLISLSQSATALLPSPTGKSHQVWRTDILLMKKKTLHVLRSKSHPKNLKTALWYSGLLRG